MKRPQQERKAEFERKLESKHCEMCNYLPLDGVLSVKSSHSFHAENELLAKCQFHLPLFSMLKSLTCQNTCVFKHISSKQFISVNDFEFGFFFNYSDRNLIGRHNEFSTRFRSNAEACTKAQKFVCLQK